MASLTVVLVVEDDAILRFHAVDIVEQAGMRAIEAANADEAVSILEERDDIRIVFTDVDMPGSMDGIKLAAAVRLRWPPIEIILTSGLIDVKPSDLPLRGVFLPKPLDSRAFVKQLRAFAA